MLYINIFCPVTMILYSVPLHPMLIGFKNIGKHVSGISETSGMKYISTTPSHVCCEFMYNLPLCKNMLHHYFA